MKTGKLALLATLTAALVFGGLSPAGAVSTDPAVSPQQAPGAGQEAESPAAPAESAAEAQLGGTAGTLPETPAAQTEEPEDTHSHSEELAPEDSGYVPVGKGHIVPGPDTPLITEPDGSVRSAVDTGHEEVPAAFAMGGAASMAPAAARAGDIKVTLVRASVEGNRSLVNMDSARQSIANSSAYWKAMSNNRLSMSVYGTLDHYSAARSTDDYATMMNTIAREIQWRDSPYTALVVFVPTPDLRSGGYGGILGGGWTVGGTAGRILMPAPSSFTNNVVTHEFGHLLGLLHANSLQCTNGRTDVGSSVADRWNDGACTSREYGDTADLMGYAQYAMPVINSLFWDRGAFGRGDEVYDAGRPSGLSTFTLRPWAGTSAHRALKFTDSSGETYYLELRLPVANDVVTAVGGNRGVKIVKADLANTWALNSVVIGPSTRPFAGYTNPNSAWQAGQTFTTHTGTVVKVNWISGDAASVTIGTEPSIPSTADLVAIDPAGDLILYPADSRGGFSAGKRIGTGWTGAVSAHAADWNGDGIIDLVSQTSGGLLQVYYGYRAGGFSGPVTVGQGWSQMRISVGRWSAGDTLPGVVAVDPRGRTWSYRNTSGGYLSSGSVIASDSVPRLFSIADLNKDGVPELVSIMGDGTLVSRARTASGTLGPSVQVGVGWQSATSLRSSVDFNGSGSLGLMATFTDGKLAYYNSNSVGGWTGSWPVGSGWYSYRPLDTQGTGGASAPITSEADVITLSGGNLHRYAARLNGVLVGPAKIGEGFYNVQSFHSTDWNRDGLPDLLVQWNEGTLSVYYGLPTGGFSAPRTVGTGWQDMTISLDRSVGGFPGVLAMGSDGSLRRYTNTDGASALRGGAVVGTGWTGLRLQVVDWDGDGITDVLAVAKSGDMLFYKRSASGAFVAGGKTVGTGWDGMDTVSVGVDVIGDGRWSLVARAGNGDLLNYPVLGNGYWGGAQKLGWGWGGLQLAGSR